MASILVLGLPAEHFGLAGLTLVRSIGAIQVLWALVPWAIVFGLATWGVALGLERRRLTTRIRHLVCLLRERDAEVKELVIGVDHNLSRAIEAEESAQSSNEILRYLTSRFQDFFSAMPVACLTCDLDGRVFEWNRAASDLWKVQGERAYLQDFAELLADRSEHATLRGALEAVGRGERVERLAWESKTRLNSVLQVESNLYPLRSAGGTVTGVVVTTVDRTAEVNERRQLEESERRFRTLIGSLPCGVVILDRTGSVVSWNGEAGRLMGLTSEATSLQERGEFPPEALARLIAGTAPGARPVRIETEEGGSRWVAPEATAIPGDDPTYSTVVSIVDVTLMVESEVQAREHAEQVEMLMLHIESQAVSLQLANETLSELATSDGLTGLPNARALAGWLSAEFESATRLGSPLSVVLLDLDRFKSLNDTFGHLAGDRALKATGELLAGFADGGVRVARHGGEEFVALLPGTGMDGARQWAEKVRSALEEADWPFRPVTATLGVAEISPRDRSPDDLLRRADAALYAGKENGRNRVVVADGASAAA